MTATRLYVRQNPIREADGWRYAEGRATEIDLETVDEYELQVLDSPGQIAKILAIDSQAEDLRRQAEDRVTTLHALLQRHPSLKPLRDEGLKDNEIVNEMKRLLEKTTEIQRGYQSGLYRRIQVLPIGTTVYRVRHEDMPERSEYTASDPQLWGPSEEQQGAGRLRIHGESLLYASTSWLTAADEAGIGPLQTFRLIVYEARQDLRLLQIGLHHSVGPLAEANDHEPWRNMRRLVRDLIRHYLSRRIDREDSTVYAMTHAIREVLEGEDEGKGRDGWLYEPVEGTIGGNIALPRHKWPYLTSMHVLTCQTLSRSEDGRHRRFRWKTPPAACSMTAARTEPRVK